ncbi:hypothetical protein O988_04259 [Pseudogymnoascus sp. VKM F-3808]|nr:hypothetical protein O988_04259 [Pseudogymnoascus sp. VKM F-3808]
MASPYRVAVIGYGFSAKVFHIPLILANPAFKLHSVVQRSPQPDSDAAKDHPNVQVWRESEDAINDSEIDVVVVSTTPSSHYELVTRALNAGRHVVVEKPACPTAKEVDQLIALAKSKQLLLTIYQNRRWDADFLTVKHLISQGVLGNVVEFESHFDRYAPAPPPATAWQAVSAPASGIVYDLGTHLIDQIVVLFGMPKKVTGFVSKLTQDRTDDAFTIFFQYPRGMLVTVKATVLSCEARQLRFWVRGDKASYKKFFMDVQEEQIMAGKSVLDRDFGHEPEAHYGTCTTFNNGDIEDEVVPTIAPLTYRTFYDELATALAGKAEVPVDAARARDVLFLVELAKQSSDEGVTLNV